MPSQKSLRFESYTYHMSEVKRNMKTAKLNELPAIIASAAISVDKRIGNPYDI